VTKNPGVKRIDTIRSTLQDTHDLLEVVSSLQPEELLDRALEKLYTLASDLEPLLTKVSKSRFFSNAIYRKRIKETLHALELESQRLVCCYTPRFESCPFSNGRRVHCCRW
jgi:hypothetical protein